MNSFATIQILNAYKKKNFRLKEKPYELNPFGIRNKGSQANTFDDILGGIYKDVNGSWIAMQFDGTTDPGVFYRENPINVEGTAIIAPGQYKDCYKVGLHRGEPAFQQVGKMGYVRDKDKNGILNYALYLLGSNIKYEIAATNMHDAAEDHRSTIVDKWSAGCQVLSFSGNLDKLLTIANTGINTYKYKNLFDYALFESDEL